MVALIVHNQMLAAISTATKLIFEAQSDRDTVEPQVQMLREFVAHNKDWCGLAKTPDDARDLIEANKMAFVLGLETDSINGWVKDEQFSPDPSDANKDKIHAEIHGYFKYLHDLGVVQVNLIHLSDNAFGGMALYDVMFMINSWQRRGVLPTPQDGFTPHQANPDEVICLPVTLESALWEKLAPEAQKLGITSPPFSGVGAYGHGDRNAHGLTTAGTVALLEAMRLGMVVDMDHMSELSSADAYAIATSTLPLDAKYPLVSAHNGARKMAPRPPASMPSPTDAPAGSERRSPHAWPSESMKSETQLDYIQTTKGMFGHGIAGADSQAYGSPPLVPNDCPGSSKTVAQGLQYIAARLDTPLGLGTDWNALLAGPGPRFGPLAGNGLAGELDPPDDMWSAAVRGTRLTGADAQDKPVVYDGHIGNWRPYPFSDAKPAADLYRDRAYAGEGRWLWQAKALVESGVDLTRQDVVDAFTDTRLARPARPAPRARADQRARPRHRRGLLQRRHHRPGSHAAGHGRPDARPAPRRRTQRRPGAMDGDAASRHHGAADAPLDRRPHPRLRLQPRRAQPLRHAPGHAPGPEERGAAPGGHGQVLPVRRGLCRGLGAERPERGEDTASHPRESLMPAWYVHIEAAAQTMERLKNGVPAGSPLTQAQANDLFGAAHTTATTSPLVRSGPTCSSCSRTSRAIRARACSRWSSSR